MLTPEEEVELVRRNLELVSHVESAREAASLLGVSPQKLIDWRKEKIAPLRGDMPKRLSSNLRRARGGRLLDGPSRSVKEEETAEEAVAINWPDVSRLKPAARAFYHEAVGEWTSSRGWPIQLAAKAAMDFVGDVLDSSTLASEGPGSAPLSEEDQLMDLKSARPVVERIYDRLARESKRSTTG